MKHGRGFLVVWLLVLMKLGYVDQPLIVGLEAADEPAFVEHRQRVLDVDLVVGHDLGADARGTVEQDALAVGEAPQPLKKQAHERRQRGDVIAGEERRLDVPDARHYLMTSGSFPPSHTWNVPSPSAFRRRSRCRHDGGHSRLVPLRMLH